MELDEAYAIVPHIHAAAEFPLRWAASAADFRNSLKKRAHLDVAYGDTPRARYDLFLPEGAPQGLFVFIHGGYWGGTWEDYDNKRWSHLAVGALSRGLAVSMPTYDLCPAVSVAEITAQVARAVTHAAAQVAGPIALAGHSAGGHLASRMLDPAVLPDPIGARIETVIPISPISDLRPLLRTTMNKKLGLDAASAAAESPVDMKTRHPAEVTVWVGGAERPAFLDQAIWLVEAWEADHVIAHGKHHFNVVDALADPESSMVALLPGK